QSRISIILRTQIASSRRTLVISKYAIGLAFFMAVVGLSGCVTTPHMAAPSANGDDGDNASREIGRDEVLAELEYFDARRRSAALKEPVALQQLLEVLYKRQAVSAAALERDYDEREEVQYALKRSAEVTLTQMAPELYIEEQEMPSFDEQARRYYEENLEKEFTPPEEIRVSHILLQATTDEAKAVARPKMERILSQIKSGDSSFREMAEQHSQDASRFMFGDLGMIRRGQMVPEFEKVAFNLEEPGDMSGIVESRFGLHLIKLTEKPSREPLPFEQVEERLKAKLKREYQQSLVDEWVASLVPREAYLRTDEELNALLEVFRSHFGMDPPAPAKEAKSADQDSASAVQSPIDAKAVEEGKDEGN
ncbi:MAG: peptidylprolyl isomerase, partial [Algiphilus sp.]